jgi:hypothetical protein
LKRKKIKKWLQFYSPKPPLFSKICSQFNLLTRQNSSGQHISGPVSKHHISKKTPKLEFAYNLVVHSLPQKIRQEIMKPQEANQLKCIPSYKMSGVLHLTVGTNFHITQQGCRLAFGNGSCGSGTTQGRI